MAIEFVYTIDDVKHEFKEILSGTAAFGRSDAEFTADDYNFKIGQLASCASQMMDGDDALKDAVASLEKSADILDVFDPRYESRFNSPKAFELDGALEKVLKKHELSDDEMNHFILLQALKRYKGIEPDAFEVRNFKEDSKGNDDIYDYLKNDFDYIELVIDDAGMVEFAESTFNDGEANYAVLTRKAFEEYACSRIVDDVSHALIKARIEGSYSTIEQKVLDTILEYIPDVRIKHSNALVDELSRLSKKLKQVPIQSYSIRDVIGNEIFAGWMGDYLSGNMNLSSLQRKIMRAHVTPYFAPFSEDIQKAYKRWLKDNRVGDVKDLAWISEINPEKSTVLDYYKSKFSEAKFKEIKKIMRISGLKPADVASDSGLQKSIQDTYKYWLANTASSSYSNNNLDYVKRGIKLSKVKPDNGIMQKFYKDMLNGDRLDGIEEAISFTAIRPDKDAVFNYYGDKFSNANFRGLRRVMRLTGIPFSQIAADDDVQKVIQRAYKGWLTGRSFETLEEGMELSNVKPEKDMVYKFYRGLLDDGKLDDVEECIEIMHILPEKDAMLSYYKYCLNNGNYGNVERAMGFSKVNPDNKTMQDFYKNKLGSNRIGDVEEGIYLSDIKPSEDLMLAFFRQRIKDDEIDPVGEGCRISEITLASLVPKHPELAKDLQAAYGRWLGTRDIENVREGVRLSRVMPEKDVMFGFYKNMLGNGQFSRVAEGMEASTVMPDETLMDPFYASWLKNDSFSYVDNAVKTINVKPGNKVMLEFYKEKFRNSELSELRSGMVSTGTNITDFISDAGLYKEIQDTYRKLLKNTRFTDLKNWVGVSTVAPENSVMQEFYMERIKSGKVGDVESMAEATKIMPDKNTMSEFFRSCFENDDLTGAARGIKFSGMKPDAEIMPGIYGRWFREGKFGILKKGAKASGVALDYKSIAKDIQSAYGTWIDNGKFDFLEEGMKLSRINPANETVQNSYDTLFRKGEFAMIEKGSKLTKIDPDYSKVSGEIQDICKKWLRYGHFDTARKGIELVKAKPDYSAMHDEIQEGYDTVAFDGFDAVEKGFGLTNVKPKDALMQRLFGRWLSKYDLGLVERGIRSIGAKPSDEMMNDFYRECFVNERIGDIEKGIELTGTEPDYSAMSKEIQYGYNEALWERRFDYLRRSMNLTGILPTEHMMFGFYQARFEKGDFGSVKSALDATGITPDYAMMKDEILKGYDENLSDGNFEGVELGFRLTGIAPPKVDMYVSKAKDKFLRLLGARNGSAEV